MHRDMHTPYSKNMGNDKHQYKLDNGLKCVLLNSKEKELENKVLLALTIKCGSLNSDSYKKETAHLLEHMQMSFDKRNKNSNKYFFAKASTNFFSTTYYISCSDKTFEFCLELLSDIFSDSRITNENRAEALKEIFEESDARYSDSQGLLLKNMYLFKDSFFEKYILNTEINNALDITINDLKVFHNKWYSVTNSQLAVIFCGEMIDFTIYEGKIKKIFENHRTCLSEKKVVKIGNIDICNNHKYRLQNVFNVNKMITVFELKQIEDFWTEKIKKGLFIQYIEELVRTFFVRKGTKLYEFNIKQFENHSFILSFKFAEIVDEKKIIAEMCYFLMDNLSILKEKILIMKEDIIDMTISSYELLEYIVCSFVYSQPFVLCSAKELIIKTKAIVNDFDVNAIAKIIRDLELAKYKSFIFE